MNLNEKYWDDSDNIL
jgi:hypothetical protein